MTANTLKRVLQASAAASVLVLFTSACNKQSSEKMSIAFPNVEPPKAKVVPVVLEKHGDKRTDNYYWLRERENPEVIAYLTAENKYRDTMMASTKKMQEDLFAEMKARIEEKDESVPYMENGYLYYYKFEEGKEYVAYYRKKGGAEGKEELMLDLNERAAGKSYYDDGGLEVSLDNKILAFAEDFVGRRIYTIRFKDLSKGTILKDEIPNTTGNLALANDNKTVFYTVQDPTTLRSCKIYKHVLGTDAKQDVLVYEEKDLKFGCGVGKTKDNSRIVIQSYSTLSSEVRYVDANKPADKFTVLLPREKDHLYSPSFKGDRVLIVTNWNAKNFRLMEAKVSDAGDKNKWKEVIAHRADVLLSDVEVFDNFMVLSERKEGLLRLRVINEQTKDDHYVDFGEPTYYAAVGTNPEMNTQKLRFRYTSLTTPMTEYEYDMSTKSKTLLKQRKVLGGFKSEDYMSERVYATAKDGVKVPISLVYKKGTKKDGSAPMLQYAYGSYGYSLDATFSSTNLSLLDRGFVYAICHIRGGEEMGRHWYEDGKFLKKKNTFTDFIACTEYLLAEKFTSSDKLFAEGGSAGGLLMGAVANMAPQLYKGVIAQVPFVDVVTTMLDESIPLTTGEYEEWGNPNDKEYYEYMKSYSPYDNVTAQNYPNMLVTTGLHDSQVQYWEPAKWVAKLRATKTDKNVLILSTNMEAGHGGASGRFQSLKERAEEMAFMFKILGIEK